MTCTLKYRRLPHRLGGRWGCTVSLAIVTTPEERRPADAIVESPKWECQIPLPEPSIWPAWQADTASSAEIARIDPERLVAVGAYNGNGDHLTLLCSCNGPEPPAATWWVADREQRERIIAWLETLPAIATESYRAYLVEQLRPWQEAHAAVAGDDGDTIVAASSEPATITPAAARPKRRIQTQTQAVAA